jgi:hypothetical protein
LGTTHSHETVCVRANGIERSGFGLWGVHGGRQGPRYIRCAHTQDSEDKVQATALAYQESRAVGDISYSFAVSVAIALKMVDLLKVAKPRRTFF